MTFYLCVKCVCIKKILIHLDTNNESNYYKLVTKSNKLT